MEKRAPVKMKIADLRQQHDAAEEMAAAILSLTAAYRDECDAVPIARLIGKLNALLRVHFAFEDTVLYPRMMCSGDGDVAALAHRFAADGGSLAPAFEEFARRWSGPSVIHAMFQLFREEAAELLGAMAARIQCENDQLYPAAERMKERRAA